ncbi:MAG: dihydropteroate synthase [Limisphaerales bacterium]
MFSFPRPALVLGVVNVTPDSFSDGGRWADVDDAVAHGLNLAREGADILDIGGESTRPGATPVSEEEELRRVVPVIERLAAATTVPLSIDTMKPAVADAAIRAGASIINDVAAHRADPALWEIVARTGAGYIAMHMKGTPSTMQEAPTYVDVVGEVLAFFQDLLPRLASAGVSAEQVALDVGIGFGKSLEHNLELLGRMATFRQLGRPLVVGVSRKSFLGRLTGAPVEGRLPGCLAVSCLARAAGVEVFRTHDVAPTTQALRVAEAVLAHGHRSQE